MGQCLGVARRVRACSSANVLASVRNQPGIELLLPLAVGVAWHFIKSWQWQSPPPPKPSCRCPKASCTDQFGQCRSLRCLLDRSFMPRTSMVPSGHRGSTSMLDSTCRGGSRGPVGRHRYTASRWVLAQMNPRRRLWIAWVLPPSPVTHHLRDGRSLQKAPPQALHPGQCLLYQPGPSHPPCSPPGPHPPCRVAAAACTGPA